MGRNVRFRSQRGEILEPAMPRLLLCRTGPNAGFVPVLVVRIRVGAADTAVRE